MNDYDKLEKEFNEKVIELQKKCPHKKTEKREELWAVGHSTGKLFRYCINCNKKLEEIK
jgi:hypothetical protein